MHLMSYAVYYLGYSSEDCTQPAPWECLIHLSGNLMPNVIKHNNIVTIALTSSRM